MSPARAVATVAVVVPDCDEAIAFDTGALGLAPIEDSLLRGGTRRVVVGGDRGARLLPARASRAGQEARIGDQTAGRVVLFLETGDFARDHAAYTAAGVRFAEGPREEATARSASSRTATATAGT